MLQFLAFEGVLGVFFFILNLGFNQPLNVSLSVPSLNKPSCSVPGCQMMLKAQLAFFPLQDLEGSDQQLRPCDGGGLEEVSDVFPSNSSAEPHQTGDAVTPPS